jgi:uncharacterized repeat protein (TIGR01451 family)
MKRISALLAISMIASQALVPVVQGMGLYDEAIEYVREEGIAVGYANGSFGENQTINRAEITKIITLAAMDEGEDMSGSNCFHDVHSEWFAPYVCTARDHGMVTGYQDGMFHPERSVSFAEASALIVRAYHGQVSTGSNWYMPYVNKLDEWNAVPPSVGMAHNPLTRGEMAYIIWKIETGRDSNDEDESEEEEDDEEQDEEDEDNDSDIDVSVRSNVQEAAAGEIVTFTITVENNGNDDVELDVEATIDSNLEFRDAPGHDDRDDERITWEDVEIDEDEEVEFTITAAVRSGVSGGTQLDIEVEADGEEDDAAVIVKSVNAQQQPQQPQTPQSPFGDPVLHWNAIAIQANADDHTGTFGTDDQGGPGASSRALAIVQAAVYDAVNSIERTHQPYIAYVPVQQNERVSMDTAVAAAAYKTLIALFPKQKSVFDVSYQAHLSRIPESAEKAAGIRIGEAAAQQILNARQNDGSVNNYVHTAVEFPGKHRPDPMNPEQNFLGAKWGEVKPFVINSGTQFRAPAPPAMWTKEYADAFNEVKIYGGDGITTQTLRTQDQTEIGLFWAYDGAKKIGTPPRFFNQITRVIAQKKGNTVAQNARLFALINIAQADAGIAAWESKYYHDVWRPIVGIREADEGTGPMKLGDNNPLTQGDPNWTPLGAPMSNMTMNNFTPPFPAYTSGHATFGAAVFETIERFYGTSDISFTITSDELNGVTTDNKGVVRPLAPRSFRNLDQAKKENADSRVYLGVHWRFDQDAGTVMGDSIANYIFDNALKPVR